MRTEDNVENNIFTVYKKCQSQRKKSDLSIGQISYKTHRRHGSHNTMELSVQLLNSINIDSDRNSNMSSVRTLRVDKEDIDQDGNDSDNSNDHFLEKSSRMLPTISCENMEKFTTKLIMEHN